MHITLIDQPSKVDPIMIFDSLVHYGETMMSKRLLKNIEIRVVGVKGLIRRDKIDADCVWEDINIRPREFTIRIDSGMGKKRTLLALAHEMVHVKQYALGQLKDYLRDSSVCSWLDERHSKNDGGYFTWPWEVEAHGMESELYLGFNKHQKEKSYAKASNAKKTKPDSSSSAHTFVQEASRRV
jgi:hypothetical protein